MGARGMFGRGIGLAGLMVVVCGSVCALASGAEDGVLRLRAGHVATAPATDLMARADAVPLSAWRHAVVQLDGPITAERRAALEGEGVRLFEYIPEYAYTADLSRADARRVRELGFVRWAGRFESSWKKDPEIGRRPIQTAERFDLRVEGELALVVHLFQNARVEQALGAIRAVPGVNVVRSEFAGDRHEVQLTAPEGAVAALAAIDAVQWIEEAPELTLRNNSARWIVQTNQSGSTPLYGAGITGLGQVIAVMDGRVNVNHCSFVDNVPIGPDHRKILAYNASLGSDTHGTHVAGTALGDSGSFNSRRGVAFDARLVYGTVPGFGQSAMFNRLSEHYGHGATIHNNSWGNDGTTAYDGLCRAIDNFSWQNDDNLVIFAVTNTSTLKNPDNAKNVLAVGASGGTGQSSICSGGRGPTVDGRRKPEIFAPGCGITSSVGSGCSSTSLSGTSMAAPVISGAAALVRQYFTDGFYPTGTPVPSDGFDPSGALLKAVMLNSTVDMTGVTGYPSDREGWGRAVVNNAVYLEGDVRRIIVHDVRNNSDDALGTGDAFETQFEIPTSGGTPLKITLVWHDAPASLPATEAWVNDLDLVVEGPLNLTYRGNQIDPLTGNSTPNATGRDERNNVEMMIASTALSGTYTVRVEAPAVHVGSQGFALVISGDVLPVEQFECLPDLAEPFGVLDIFDVLAFLELFEAEDPAADFAAPFGVFDIFDVLAFLDLFEQGCP